MSWQSFILVFALLVASSGVSKAETGIVVAHTQSMELSAVVTAYSSDAAQTDSTPHITANGQPTRNGVVACPPMLPFWTVVDISGTLYVCLDRTNKRYHKKDKHGRYRFDIWMPSTREALQHGVKKTTVRVVSPRPTTS